MSVADAPSPAQSAATADSPIVYRIDRLDRIIDVSSTWYQFADANDGTPTVARMLGQSIWNGISERHTRSVYQLLFDAVRASEQPVSFPYRCDSPTLERHMRLSVSAEEDGQLHFHSEVLAMKPLPELFRVVGSFPYSIQRVNICSQCRKIRIGDQWVEVADAFLSGNLTSRHNFFLAVYRLCHGCKHRMESVSASLMETAKLNHRKVQDIMARYREAIA